MSPSTRPAVRVSAEHLRSLDDCRLRDVMQRLLRGRSPLPRLASAITVSDNVNAKDEGCDGWSPAHRGRTDWLPGVDTCWQFKSGSAGEPAKLKGEVVKPIPRRTLEAGGAYIVVASQASGKAAADKRLRVVRQEAQEAALPTDRIAVYTCESLAAWCNSIPAVSSWVIGVPHGFLLFGDWARDGQHVGPFHASKDVASQIDRARRFLEFCDGPIAHLHIDGQPGVGRTRLALEIVRNAGLQEFAIYCPTSDQPVFDFVGQVRGDPSARLLLVVDQIASDAVGILNQQVRLADGRIRLITIGSEQLNDSGGIELLQLGRLDRHEMSELVRQQSLGLHFEQVDFVASFADGYIKLARIVWTALRADSDARVLQSLLGKNDIRGFLRRLLGGLDSDDLVALQAIALMSRIGWNDEAAGEGEAVIGLLGLEWPEVRRRVHRIHQRTGIVPLAGRFRYLSPQPLALLLAREALDDYRAILPKLPDRFPSDAARLALFKRLSQLSDHPVATAMCRRVLGGFSSLSDFERRWAAEIWDQVAMAEPAVAIRGFASILVGASPGQKKTFAINQFLVLGTLEKITQRSDTFDETMFVLADLALAESKGMLYGPSRVFCDRYRVILAGTVVPFVERLRVLDDLGGRSDPAYTDLVIRAHGRSDVGTRARYFAWESRTSDSDTSMASQGFQGRHTGSPGGTRATYRYRGNAHH